MSSSHISKKEMIKADIDGLSDDQVNEIYDKYFKKPDDKAVEEVVEENGNNVDKTTLKYKVLLEFVNGILNNLNKDKIADLTQFKNINRLDIIRNDNVILLEEMTGKLFKHYDKATVGYYRKGPNWVLSCLRGMCKDIGLKCLKTQKAKSIKSKIITQFFYSIV